MGDAANADEQRIPDFERLDPSENYLGTGYLLVDVNFMRETGNILDLSRVEFLHQSSLGTSKVSQGKIEVHQDGDVVYSRRATFDEILMPELAARRGIPPDQPVGRWLDVRWNALANMRLEAGYVHTGRPREEGLVRYLAHLFTPETGSTTHYWFGVALPHDSIAVGEDGQATADRNVQWLTHPFAKEHLPMLQARQRVIGNRDFWSLKPVLLPSDGVAVRARRLLDKMICSEQQAQGHIRVERPVQDKNRKLGLTFVARSSFLEPDPRR